MAIHVARLTQLGLAKKLVPPLISSSTVPWKVAINYYSNTLEEVENFNRNAGSGVEIEDYDTSSQPFQKEILNILRAPLNEKDIEIKPDGTDNVMSFNMRCLFNRYSILARDQV